MTVNTRNAERREISYRDMNALLTDLDAIQSSHDAGTLQTTGNWSPGQIMRHAAILMECALDGFPIKPAPWIIRAAIQALYKKKALAGAPPRSGTRIPVQASFLDPGDAGFDEGMSSLRRVAERVNAGERFTQPSPIFGELTHDEWVCLGLGHTALHTSFIRID